MNLQYHTFQEASTWVLMEIIHGNYSWKSVVYKSLVIISPRNSGAMTGIPVFPMVLWN